MDNANAINRGTDVDLEGWDKEQSTQHLKNTALT